MGVIIDRYRGRLEVYVNNLPLIDGHTGKIASFKEARAELTGTYLERGCELERVLTFLVGTTENDASSRNPSHGD